MCVCVRVYVHIKSPADAATPPTAVFRRILFFRLIDATPHFLACLERQHRLSSPHNTTTYNVEQICLAPPTIVCTRPSKTEESSCVQPPHTPTYTTARPGRKKGSCQAAQKQKEECRTLQKSLVPISPS